MRYTLINQINEGYTPIEQILTNRGIKIENIPHYLNLTENDVIPPLQLKNIDQAIVLLLKHLSNPKSRIACYVDCDFDGYASSALLLNYVHEAFPSAIDKITYILHDDKTHGIELDKLPLGTTLVMVPDAGSNQYEIHEQLQKIGIDVCCLDHHIASKESEFACVVNNQLCDYPNKSLCGTGIVYKMCQRIDDLIGENYSKNLLDLVATSLIADMVDLRDMETRYLVQEGLQKISNPFLQAMIEKNSYQLKDNLTPMGIAFYVVPYVNAITRVGTIEEKIALFESMLSWRSYTLVDSTKRGCKGEKETIVSQAIRACTNAKSRQNKFQDAEIEKVESQIIEQNLLDHKVLLVCVEGDSIEPSLTGLIANRLMAKYQRPAILLRKIDDNTWSGSGRGYSRCDMTDFRGFIEDSGLAIFAQGHKQAFGCSFTSENIPLFMEYADKQLENYDFSAAYKVDFIYSAHNISSNDVLNIGNYSHLWGQNIEQPLIAIEHINVTADMLFLMSRDKNPTLKISLPNGINIIKFKSSEEEYNSFLSTGCVTINIVGKAEINRYYDSVTPQILVEDYEIVNKQNFYF